MTGTKIACPHPSDEQWSDGDHITCGVCGGDLAYWDAPKGWVWHK